ncbi:MAG: hypothetical protein NTY36_09375 [Deltaproteobacteria bacterium]|nr:hypothetical protein [Deltaproteobacteria bacterium]
MTIIKNDSIHCSNYSNGHLILNKEFILIVTIATALAVFFIFDGFILGDSIRYALGVKALEQNNYKVLPSVFNYEMSFGYYLVIIWLKTILNFQGELSRLMNGLSAGASVLMTCFLFMFVQSLFNRRIAFFTCLSVLLSPAIWMLSHYGNPNILGMSFFLGSLFFLDKSISSTGNSYLKNIYWISFTLLVFTAVTVRMDMALAFGAYFGLIYFRRARITPDIIKLIGALAVALLLTYGLRYYIWGNVVDQFRGALGYHLGSRLPAAQIFPSIIKNLSLWMVGANIFVAILALLGLRRFGLKSGIVVLFSFWLLPFLIYLPFQGMDTPRLIAPTIPAICLVAMGYLDHNFESVKKKTLFMLLVLVLAQMGPAVFYYPAEKFYQRYAGIKRETPPAYPLGLIPLDHFRLQRFVRAQDDLAKRIAGERNGNVLIIDFSPGVMYYIYHLMVSRSVFSQEIVWCDNVRLKKFVTKENTFLVMDKDINIQQRSPISTALQCPKISVNKVHLSPFSGEFPFDKGKLYLGEEELKSLLENETSLFQHMREVIR